MAAGHAAVTLSLDRQAAWHMAHRPASAMPPSGYGEAPTTWGRLLGGSVEVVDFDVDGSDA
jgi:hypothetical protein